MRTSTACANFPDLEAMLAAVPDLDCVSICTPPQAHFDAALMALRAGKHVMLEKPPTATTRQIALLAEEAARRGRTLFQTWHSRFAAGVDAAREWLRTRTLVCGKIIWKEDVHQWHPGPALDLGAGRLWRVRPRHQCAVAAHRDPARGSLRRTRVAGISGEPAGADRGQSRAAHRQPASSIAAEFDFRQKGEQSWDIELVTTTGILKLSGGGAELEHRRQDR